MDSDFLQTVGYKVETKLSAIKRTVPTAEWDSQAAKRALPPIAALEASLNELKEPLQRKEVDDLPNPFQLGFRYAEKGLDPTIAEIWNSVAADPEKKGIGRWRNSWAEGAMNKELRAQVTAEITAYIENIVVGFKIFSAIPHLESKLAIIQRSKEFFTNKEKQTKDFDRLIGLVDLLLSSGFKLTDTVVQLVEKRKIVEEMNKVLDHMATPDMRRTIEDRIGTIKAKIGGDQHSSVSLISSYEIGYWMAIRGEDKTIFDLVDRYVQFENGRPEVHTGAYFLLGTREKWPDFVNTVLEGYAASYHLAFLEKKLSTLSQQAGASDAAAKEKPVGSKLKWKGQKNQLYEVLRILKEKDLLTGSYEDLALFIKTHVEGFADTALSTIVKQLARPQNLPKDRRINLDPKK